MAVQTYDPVGVAHFSPATVKAAVDAATDEMRAVAAPGASPEDFAAIMRYPLPAVTSWVMVGPEMARAWLKRNTNNYRKLTPETARMYAAEMTAGRWERTGDTVKFAAADGHLMDGQHRLVGIATSGVTVPLLVVPDLADGARKAIDTGSGRTAAVILAADGEANATMLGAIARIGLASEKGRLDSGSLKIATTEIASWVDLNPDSREFARRTFSVMDSNLKVPSSVIAYTWMQFARIDSEAAERFWHDLKEMNWEGQKDPRKALWRRAQGISATRTRVSRGQWLSMIYRTWNAWRRGEELGTVQMTSGKGDNPKNIPIPKLV